MQWTKIVIIISQGCWFNGEGYPWNSNGSTAHVRCIVEWSSFLSPTDFPPPYPAYPHIQTSPAPLHGYGIGDRKFSAPVLGSNDMKGIDRQEDHHIVRSNEVENIPETVQEEPTLEDFPPSLVRWVFMIPQGGRGSSGFHQY